MSDKTRESYAKAYRPLSETLRKKVVDELTTLIEERFLDPSLGQEINAALERNMKEYRGIAGSDEFSIRLMEDIRAITDNAHIAIWFHEPYSLQSEQDEKPSPEPEFAELLEQFKAQNYGFGNASFDTESLPGRKIATLPINGFIPTTKFPEVRAGIGAIMSSVADSSALILDLRHPFSSGPDQNVAFILSYLLDSPDTLHISDIVDRVGYVNQSIVTL